MVGNNGTMLKRQCERIRIADSDAELGLAWAMLFAPGVFSEVGDRIRPKMFTRVEYGWICNAFRKVVEAGDEPNAVNIAHYLEGTGLLDQIGGEDYLAGIEERIPHSGHTKAYVERVIDRWKRREVIRKANEIIEAAELPEGDYESLIDTFGNNAAEFNATKPEQFQIYSASELESLEIEDAFLIEGVLKKGQPAGFGGPLKSLKTTLMMLMALCLPTQRRFLGKFKVPKHVPTLVFSGESGLMTLREIGRRIAMSWGWSFGSIDGFYISPSIPRLDLPEQIKAFEKKIIETKAEAVFCDPYYLMAGSYGSDASNVMQMGNVLRDFAAIGERTGATLILIHHTKKTLRDPYEPAELQDFSQAGFAEFVRQYFMSNRREKWDSGNPGVHKMWFGWGGSAGQGGLVGLNFDETKNEDGKRTWNLEVITPEQAYAQRAVEVEERKESGRDRQFDAKRSKAIERLLKAFEKFPEGATARQLRTEAKLNGETSKELLSELEETGQIEAFNIVKNHQTYSGYRLTGTPGQTQWDKDLSRFGGGGTGQTPFRGCPSPVPPGPLGQHQFELDDLPPNHFSSGDDLTPSGEPTRGTTF